MFVLLCDGSGCITTTTTTTITTTNNNIATTNTTTEQCLYNCDFYMPRNYLRLNFTVEMLPAYIYIHGNLMPCRVPYTGLLVLVFLGMVKCTPVISWIHSDNLSPPCRPTPRRVVRYQHAERLLTKASQDQDQDSLLVKRRNDNHSPGPVISP